MLEKMKFVFPCAQYEQKATEYIGEFHACKSPTYGTAGLETYLSEHSYSEWLLKIVADLDVANISPGRVPALTYFYVREEDDKIIGMINIRFALNDFLRKVGGHIGYNVRPTERQKGYATCMLRETLEFCKIIGLNEVIVSCNKDNIASAKVIKNCGGQLEREFFSDQLGRDMQKYIIKN